MNCNGKCVKGGIHPDCPQHCKGEWRKPKKDEDVPGAFGPGIVVNPAVFK